MQEQPNQQTPQAHVVLVELRHGNKSRLLALNLDDNTFSLTKTAALESFGFLCVEIFLKVDTQEFLVLGSCDIDALCHAGLLKGAKWVFDVRDCSPQQPKPLVWRTIPVPSGEAVPRPRFAFAHEALDPAQLQHLAHVGVTGPAGQKFNFSGLPAELLQSLPKEVSQFLLVKQ